MMQKMKKWNVIGLCMFLIFCNGCAKAQPETIERAGHKEYSAYEILTFPLIAGGEEPGNLEQVQAVLNEYVADKIEAVIQLETVDIESLKTYYLMQISSSDVADFLCLIPAESELSTMVNAGLLLPLDDLLEKYAPGVEEAAKEILAVGQMDGVQYMIPQVKDTYTMGTSVEINAELAKKYEFNLQNIRTITDLEPMLQTIIENEADVIPFCGTLDSTGYIQPLSGYDNLTDTLGVLNLQDNDELKVVDWYETDEFMDLAKLMHKWHQKGYIAQDALTLQKTATELVRTGKAFCNLSTIMPGSDEGIDGNSSSGVIEIQLTDQPQLLTSYYMGLSGIGISSSCKSPEKAMKFIELLYTDPYVVNLLQYGIEGENYTLNSEGLVDQGESYFLLYGQTVNQKLLYHTIKDGIDYDEKCKAYQSKDINSPALGFVFDTVPVAREISLCQSVVEHYYPVIDCGCVNPEEEIPIFVEALKEAGIDTIVEEKQRQLDEWVEK